ncbi:hypothetical protein SLEP1_g53271 [Rubroshorea leprosula]|uniref:HMA domain-containing protein n=1 Tax=Rubroshorea leprosula TaxID=152421 RepID=A0AAV5M8Z3_9ROSI|nr:hypothetical protein SLEP1_g53271 [Rubroshorea leprosula]
MKQKMAIKVSMNGQKSRSKAMKIVVGLPGVESAALKGDDKTQIEVTGDGVDAAQLTMLLRKKVGFAELVSVTAVGGEKKEEKKEDKKEDPKAQPLVWPSTTPYYIYEVPPTSQYHDPCSIM